MLARVASLQALGRDDEAAAAQTAADALVHQIGDTMADESLRDAFLSGWGRPISRV
jgi:hypothetical protein